MPSDPPPYRSTIEEKLALICDGCGSLENSPKRCGSCKEAMYCSRDCQRSHWKLHKPECQGKSRRTNVPKEAIKHVAHQIRFSYTERLKLNGTPVALEHEKAVFPKTVNFLKQYLIDHPQWDSELKFLLPPEGNDEMQVAINKFFRDQPGYEPLARAVPASMMRQRENSYDKTKEIFDEQVLKIFVDDLVTSLMFPLLGSPNPQMWDILFKKKGAKERVHSHVLASARAYLLSHPNYNSYEGITITAQEKFRQNQIQSDPFLSAMQECLYQYLEKVEKFFTLDHS